MQPVIKTIAKCSLSHKTCNFDCENEVCKNKICGHQVYQSNQFFHFGPIEHDEYLKPGQNEIECGIVFDDFHKVIDDDEDLFFRINWRVAKDIYITKIAKTNVGEYRVGLINTNSAILHIEKDCQLLCGKPEKPGICKVELNHLTTIEMLEPYEQEIHCKEYSDWEAKRKKLVAEIDFKGLIT